MSPARRITPILLTFLLLAMPAGAVAAGSTTSAAGVASGGLTIIPGGTSPVVKASRGRQSAKPASKLSNGAIVAAIVAGLLALACLLWGVFRFGAYEPHWLLSLRHSLAEAGFRASATWAEFTDWFRLGH